MAAAKGMLPLASDDMLEAVVLLLSEPDEEIARAAVATTETLDPNLFAGMAGDESASPALLGFLCVWTRLPREMIEAVIFNASTPDAALAQLASKSNDPSVIEAISVKQQSLIRCPDIIDAILANPVKTPEAERRAREVREEFFEKQFGVRLVAEEQRARSEAQAAAQQTLTVSGIEDLVSLGLIEEGIDDSIVIEYETEYGPFNETAGELRAQQFDIDRVIAEVEAEEETDFAPDRLPIFQQIALMSIKDRVMLAIKGTKEARMILARDPNRIVATAVLRNPRLTDQEIESISAMRTAPEEVLRQIAQSRAWTRSYNVIHSLVKNPRTPLSASLGFLNRIQTRDLKNLAINKNIPDVVRTSASRLFIKRSS